MHFGEGASGNPLVLHADAALQLDKQRSGANNSGNEPTQGSNNNGGRQGGPRGRGGGRFGGGGRGPGGGRNDIGRGYGSARCVQLAGSHTRQPTAGFSHPTTPTSRLAGDRLRQSTGYCSTSAAWLSSAPCLQPTGLLVGLLRLPQWKPSKDKSPPCLRPSRHRLQPSRRLFKAWGWVAQQQHASQQHLRRFRQQQRADVRSLAAEYHTSAADPRDAKTAKRSGGCTCRIHNTTSLAVCQCGAHAAVFSAHMLRPTPWLSQGG